MAKDEWKPEIVPLEEPRDLTDAERGLLLRLLTAPVITPALRQQAQSVQVVGTCNCGCPSVSLGVASDAPRARWAEPHPDVRGDDAEVYAHAVNSEGRHLDVVLHILSGRLEELEVWGRDPARPRVALPEPDALCF